MPLIPVSYPRSFSQANGLQPTGVPPDFYTRFAVTQSEAQAFYQAVVQKPQKAGAPKTEFSQERIQALLQQVHRKNGMPAFNQAVAQLAMADGKPYQNAQDLLIGELFHNPFKRFFKSATQKELLDNLKYGENRFSASSLEYRKLGMWNAVADFVAVCKQYPVMSAGVIGAVAYFGHRYPFLGALSGAMIIAWGAGASAIHEIKAALLPKQPSAQRADHYTRSGENMAAALITALGYKGIKNGNINGFEHAKEKAALMTSASKLRKTASGSWAAVKATSTEKNKTNLIESLLFVTGLFDNVLLPFNWLADRLKINK